MSTYFETPSDTGVTHTELVALKIGRVVSDTGVTNTESLVRLKSALRTLSDTATTITESLPKHVRHPLSDTGVTFSEAALDAYVRPADNATFTYLCSRNWTYIENQSGWSSSAYNRFTYTTIAD